MWNNLYGRRGYTHPSHLEVFRNLHTRYRLQDVFTTVNWFCTMHTDLMKNVTSECGKHVLDRYDFVKPFYKQSLTLFPLTNSMKVEEILEELKYVLENH